MNKPEAAILIDGSTVDANKHVYCIVTFNRVHVTSRHNMFGWPTTYDGTSWYPGYE